MSTKVFVGLGVQFHQNPQIFITPKDGYCAAIVVDVPADGLAGLVVFDAGGYSYRRKRVPFVPPGTARLNVDYFCLLDEPEANQSDGAQVDEPEQ